MTKNISDLPRELTEEVLCRLPVKSLRAVRSTCKTWNNLTKDRILIKKKKRNEYHVVMIFDFRVYLMSVNFHSRRPIERLGKLNIRVKISKIFHCDGLLLCSIENLSKLVVWNPYLGQTKWIKPRTSYNKYDSYALGYDKKKKKYKILRFLNYGLSIEYEIFSFKSNSWKIFDGVTPEHSLLFRQHCVSLDGNTYWLAQDKPSGGQNSLTGDHLLSFDFTMEKFGLNLSLPPFHATFKDTVILSSLNEKQLVVLFQKYASPVQIWITRKIEPNAISWELFFEYDMKTTVKHRFCCYDCGSFLVDEEKNVMLIDKVKVYSKDECKSRLYNAATISGTDGYITRKILRKSIDATFHPFMCRYHPSLVEI